MGKDKEKQESLAKSLSELTQAINALTRAVTKKPRVFVLQFGADIPINQKET